MVATWLNNRMADFGSSLTGSIRSINSDQQGQRFGNVAGRYAVLESYYDNEMYTSSRINSGAATAKSINGLYRNVRPIYNALRRAVDIYPGHIYPGAFTNDGLALPDGTPSCVPFASDTDEALRLASSAVLGWGNWGSERYAVCRQLALLGDIFGEIQIDYERGKVYPKFHHPSLVADIEWNGSGDIIMYRLDIPMFDEATKTSYRYGKIVTKETVTTLYNERLHSYDGEDPESDNVFGFCYAAWGQFRNVGGQHGASLLDGVRGKIDQLNSIVSSTHDYIHKFANQGLVIAAKEGRAGFEAAMARKVKAGPTDEMTNPQAGREELPYLFAPEGTTFFKPIENLGLAEAVPYLDSLRQEIEADLPEATMEERISQHPQVSGVALRMMFPGVDRRVQEAQGNADATLVKLMQMGVSIGGHLARSEWGGSLTDTQKLFQPFDVASYDRGELWMTLLPRPLFPLTTMDRISAAAAMEALRTKTAMMLAGLDEETIFALIEDQQALAITAGDVFGRAFNSGAV